MDLELLMDTSGLETRTRRKGVGVAHGHIRVGDEDEDEQDEQDEQQQQHGSLQEAGMRRGFHKSSLKHMQRAP